MLQEMKVNFALHKQWLRLCSRDFQRRSQHTVEIQFPSWNHIASKTIFTLASHGLEQLPKGSYTLLSFDAYKSIVEKVKSFYLVDASKVGQVTCQRSSFLFFDRQEHGFQPSQQP